MLSSVSLRTPLRFLLLLASFILLSSNSALGQESQAIGRVVTATGMVTASDQAGVTRELQRRSDIFVGDTITTGPAGFTQLRMVDSAQISFKEDTVFTFEAYNSDGPGGAPDNALMNMVQGGFRTISGTIGDDPNDDYEVSTQFASIGIRGTTHEAVIDVGSLLTGVYDGGTTIANAQGTLDTGVDANFNYSQTFPGQAPQGLLQQPVQLGQININQQGGDDDADDDGDDNNADDGANDGDDGDDGGDGGLADADDEEPATRPLGNQQGDDDDPEQRFGIASNNDPDTDLDPTNDTRTEGELNPVINVRNPDDFENTGTGVVDRGDDPDDPGFIQPSEDFLALVANSGFNTDFSLSELAGTTGRVSQVLAFNGLADTGGISAQAVGDNGPTTPITALNMSFDLNFSASLGQVSNGLLEIRLDDAPTPIAFNIFFNGTIQNSVADFIIASNSNRIQGNSSTAIDTSVSFLDGILVDDGTSQALFSEFFFQDTQGLAVEGETLVGFATPVLSPADRTSISDRVGFLLSRNAAPGAIFPGNVTPLAPGNAVILAGSDPQSPFTVSLEPPYIFRGAGTYLDFTDGSITDVGENPYNFEIGVWNSASLFDDFADNSQFEEIDTPLLVVSVDPAPLATLSGSRTYVSNFDERILGGSSQGAISEFFTAFDVDFTSALITNGVMQFCLGGGDLCYGNNAQYWDFDYSGSVIDGYVVAAPVNNTGYINHQLASIYGSIQGVFTGDNGEAFVGGLNLFYDADLDEYIDQLMANAVNIPDTTVDGVFLLEVAREDPRFAFISDTEDRPIQQSDLNSLGFFMALDPNNSNIQYITPVRSPYAGDDDNVFAEINPNRPLYPFGFGDIFTAGLDPNDEVLDESEIGIDGLFDTYGFSWGIWVEPESGAANGPRVYTNPGDPSEFMLLSSGDGLDEAVEGPINPSTAGQFWGLVNEPVISDYTGQATYSHFLNDEGFFALGSGPGWADDEVEIYDLDFAFDVDFSNGLVSNGFLNLGVEIYDVDSQIWKSTFAGMVRDGYFQASDGALRIFESDGMTLITDNTEGNVQGVFGGGDGFEGGAEMYPAFFGGFNFANLDHDTAVTGVFISEVNPQHSAAQLSALAETYEDWYQEYSFTQALVNIPNPGEIGLIDKAGDDPIFYKNSLGGFNDSLYGISSDQLNSDNVDVFFHAYDYFDDYYNDDCECYLNYTYFNGIQFTQTVSEHAGFSHFDENSFQLSEEFFDLDMGYWTGSEGVFEAGVLSTFYDEEDCPSYSCVAGFDLEQSSFDTPAYWLNFTDNYLEREVEGYFSTVIESFGEFRLTNSDQGIIAAVPVEQLTVNLFIDFYYSEVDGQLVAVSAMDDALTAPLQWSADFNDVDFYDISEYGDFSFNIDAGDGILDGSPDSDVIIKISGSEDLPVLVGSYQSTQDLYGGGSIGVAGIFAAQETRIGIIVERAMDVNETLVPGSVYMGSASAPLDEDGYYLSNTVSPRIGLNFDANGAQNLTDPDFAQSYDVVLTGTSTLEDIDEDAYYSIEEVNYSDANIWGYWDSENMTLIHNQGNSSLDVSDSIIWASVTPADALELADMSGSMSYYGNDAIGVGTLGDNSGTEATIKDFWIDFELNFDTGIISNGNFMADLNNDSYDGSDWELTFDGVVDGAFLEMSNLAGSINSSPILGEMAGVLTSGYDGVVGFSLYTAMGDYLDGIGEFCYACE